MKKFLLYCLLFLACIILSLRIFDSLFPYYVGNEYFTKKTTQLDNSKYNSVFFGSSQVFRQLNPLVIDSALQHDRNLVSYNMGCPANFNPEAYYLTRKFLEKCDSGQIKQVIFQVQDLSDIDPKNSRTLRGYYWINLNELRYAINYCFFTNLTRERRIKMATKYLLAYIYKQLDITRLKQYLFHKTDFEQVLIGSNGFNPHTNKTAVTQEQINNYAQKSLVLDKVERANEMRTNNAHVQYLISLFKLAESKGAKLYYFISPRSMNYTYAQEIMNKLPANSLINLASAKKFPELYEVNTSYDRAHLNEQGAILMSRLVAKEILNLEKTSIK